MRERRYTVVLLGVEEDPTTRPRRRRNRAIQRWRGWSWQLRLAALATLAGSALLIYTGG